MVSEWTTSHGLDVHLDLDGSGTGRRAAIEEALRTAIQDGRLGAGAALPSTRALARDLRRRPRHRHRGLEQLVAEGWLTARRGSGTVVAWSGEWAGGPRAARRTVADPPASTHNLRPGSPDVSSFPRQEWSAAVRRALRTAPDSAFGYGDARGLADVREAVAGYLARARGVRADPERLVVCGGFVQGLSLLATFRELGTTTVGMENPCMTAYRDLTARAGLTVRFLDVDDDGADPARLDGPAGRGVGAVFVTPAHQYPTGTTLSPPRRAALAVWARAVDGYVVEDDYDGELRYDRQPVGALQAIDPDRVVYVGTASKSLAPGLRLGWMVLPEPLLAPVTLAKELADRQNGVVEQLALAELISSGGLDRHIRRARLRYRRRRDELIAALAVPRCGPGAAPPCAPTCRRTVRAGPGPPALAADGVAADGLGRYWHRPGPRPSGLVASALQPSAFRPPGRHWSAAGALLPLTAVRRGGRPGRIRRRRAGVLRARNRSQTRSGRTACAPTRDLAVAPTRYRARGRRAVSAPSITRPTASGRAEPFGSLE
jgi:GntR family transcriptional regulator/MocR family aminotransferase